MEEKRIERRAVYKLALGTDRELIEDAIAQEEPLEITMTDLYGPVVYRKKAISITMRSAGHDKDLALGFLFSEGIITRADQLKQVRQEENKIDLVLAEHSGVVLDGLSRNFYATSSCGVCGKSSIEALQVTLPAYQLQDISTSADLLRLLPNRLRKAQTVFDKTGGLHAAALFNLQGEIQGLREDVGRHNALDKLVGNAFYTNALPLDQSILVLSGRASFELVQKAAMAGIQIVAAIGAPSSLAIDLASEQNITLIGFLSAQRFNIYSGIERIQGT